MLLLPLTDGAHLCPSAQQVEEESIRDNFVITYELMDEMMDFGYPQISEAKILREYITQVILFLFLSLTFLETSAPAPAPPLCALEIALEPSLQPSLLTPSPCRLLSATNPPKTKRRRTSSRRRARRWP